ncbi:MAG: hypothetical protein ACI9SP_002229 [Arenicella sp.]|jgi:hypothetical protein
MANYYHPHVWINPKTNEEFDLSHCSNFVTPFRIKRPKTKVLKNIDARVLLSSHCFNRKRPESDVISTTYEMEKKGDGSIEDRVFCPDRWEFSKKIPGIIQDLEYRGCFGGNSKQLIFRQELPKKAGSHEGWYLCLKLNYSSNKGLEIRVTSCHYRLNRPTNIRSHGSTRFYVLLNKFMEGKI